MTCGTCSGGQKSLVRGSKVVSSGGQKSLVRGSKVVSPGVKGQYRVHVRHMVNNGRRLAAIHVPFDNRQCTKTGVKGR
jgi:hypothetical protein